MGERTPDRPVAEVFDLIALLAIKRDAAPMTRWPNGWHVVLDEHWTFTVNGQRHEIKAGNVPVPSFHCYVEFNGWPAGLFSPFDGFIAAGTVANETAFADALRAAITSFIPPRSTSSH